MSNTPRKLNAAELAAIKAHEWDESIADQTVADLVCTVEEAQAQVAKLEAGVMPRRYEEWHDDHGEVLWWDTEMTGGKIAEPPTYVGTPTSSDWPFDPVDEPHLLWVPLPKLAASRPAVKA